MLAASGLWLRLGILGLLGAGSAGLCDASDALEYDELIPHHLLGLVHAPETQAELKLTAGQVTALETLFQQTDAKWFPSRNLEIEKRNEIIRELEQAVRDWFKANTSEKQCARLKQLELYAQGERILLREDVGKLIGLPHSQQEKLAELARATDSTRQKLANTQFGDPSISTLQSTLTQHIKDERAAQEKALGNEQRQKLSTLLGSPFDVGKLKRIYAMAPEFADVKQWINSDALTMKELRGRVVIVHFYAFQCHNCHANFPIYQRWQKELSDKGVVVIGIQTPETPSERNPDAVKQAAFDRKLEFPIAVDLESSTWQAWGNTMWPTVYVVDKQGYIRHWWQGELNWRGATADKTIEELVTTLLAER